MAIIFFISHLGGGFIFAYRGFRIRPWHLNLLLILHLCLALPFLIGIGYFGFLNYQALVDLDVLTIGIVVGSLIVVGVFVHPLHRFLEERFLFYKKIYRLWLTANYLYEHSFVYEKTKKNGRTKIRFPKVFLKQGKYNLRLYLGTQGNKFQEKFYSLGSELETTFAMDFMDKEDEEKFVIYELAYSAFLNRIHAREVYLNDKYELVLSKVVSWSMLDNPHLLIVGGTGGGKTVLLRSILVGLLEKCIVYIGDPKRADFVPLDDLDVLKGRVFYEKEDIVKMVSDFKETMNKRFDFMRSEMKRLGQHDLGPFYEYGLKPCILMLDEWNAFMASLDNDYKMRNQFTNDITEIILKGRQSGCYVVGAMQKPSSDDLPTKIRSNMMHHISMGRLDANGYLMAFGEENQDKRFKFIRYLAGKKVYGRGYTAIFGMPAQEFYAPLIDKDFSFYDIFVSYDRIENPLEQDKAIEVVQEEEIPETVVIDLPIQRKEEKEVILSDGLADGLSIGDYARRIGKTFGQVSNLIKNVENGDYKKFDRVDGKVSLSEDDCLLLDSLFSAYDDFDGTWKEMLAIHFEMVAD